MVNPLKLKEMISLASYEQGEGARDIRICRYYRSDYIGLRLIVTFFLTAAADVLVLILIAAANAEAFSEAAGKIDYLRAGVFLLLFFLVTEAFFLLVTFLESSHRYRRAASRVSAYRQRMALLRAFSNLGDDGEEEDAGD